MYRGLEATFGVIRSIPLIVRDFAPYVKVSKEINTLNAACHIKTGPFLGSGCLVDAQLLGLPEYCIMTNHHVMFPRDGEPPPPPEPRAPGQMPPNSAHATFKFSFSADQTSRHITVRLDPHRGLCSDYKPLPDGGSLDYCIVAVSPDDVSKLKGKMKPVPLPAPKARRPAKGAVIFIRSHPPTRHNTNVVTSDVLEMVSDQGALRFQNSSERGCSGSPIFDNEYNLIGILAHELPMGFDTRRINGVPLPRGAYPGVTNGGCLLLKVMEHAKKHPDGEMASLPKPGVPKPGVPKPTPDAAGIAPLVTQVTSGTAAQKEKAAEALGNLADGKSEPACKNKRAIARAGGIPPLVKLVREGTGGQKQHAAFALAKLAEYSDENKLAIARENGIAPLVQLVSSGKAKQKEWAAQALGNLAAKTDANKSAIASAGAIAPLVEMVTSGTAGEKEWAALALANLAANNPTNQSAIVRAGGIKPLMELERKGTAGQKHHAEKARGYLQGIEANKTIIMVAQLSMGTDAQKQEAAQTLAALSDGKADVKFAMVKAGAIAPLVGLVSSGTAKQKESAAEALGNLACNVPENKVAIAKTGVIKALVTLVASGTAGQKENAARALFNLAGSNPDNKTAIAKAGGIAPLVKLATSGTAAQKDIAKKALRNLASNHGDNKAAIQRAGFADF